MSENSQFKQANKLAQEKARELSEECLAVIQSGSSLRKKDFSEYSDVDILAVYKEKPDKHGSDYKQGIEIQVLQRSEKEFIRNLELGNPFELTAIKHGKVLEGRDYLEELEKEKYKPSRLTFQTYIQGGLNHYRETLMSRNFSVKFYNSAYHTCRDFSLYLILHEQGKFVEGDLIIKKELEEIDSKLSENFWELRGKRLDPPNGSEEFLEIPDLVESELYKVIRKAELVGEKVFEIEDLEFPSLKKLNRKIKERGYKLEYTPHIPFWRKPLEKEAHVTVRKEGSQETKSLVFDLKTGDLREE